MRKSISIAIATFSYFDGKYLLPASKAICDRVSSSVSAGMKQPVRSFFPRLYSAGKCTAYSFMCACKCTEHGQKKAHSTLGKWTNPIFREGEEIDKET